MEKGTFSDAAIIEKIGENFIPVKVKTTQNDTYHTPKGDITTMQLVQALKIRGVPAVYFFDQNGQVVFSVPGYASADDYRLILDYISEGHYNNKTFQKYREDLKG